MKPKSRKPSSQGSTGHNSIREIFEILVVLAVGFGIIELSKHTPASYLPYLVWAVVFVALAKTAYYFGETLWYLVKATASDMPYHRFLVLMGYNMFEVTISFAIDFYTLQNLDRQSFSGIPEELRGGELLFECFYFSVLNFSFFGYGDITPSHIPAKIVMLLEVITAFTTVIFLISDFVSMKDSINRKKSQEERDRP